MEHWCPAIHRRIRAGLPGHPMARQQHPEADCHEEPQQGQLRRYPRVESGSDLPRRAHGDQLAETAVLVG